MKIVVSLKLDLSFESRLFNIDLLTSHSQECGVTLHVSFHTEEIEDTIGVCVKSLGE